MRPTDRPDEQLLGFLDALSDMLAASLLADHDALPAAVGVRRMRQVPPLLRADGHVQAGEQ